MLLLVALFICTSVNLKAQSPQKINFQSIVRNTSGVIVSNKSVSFKITILSGSITGTPVYSETHVKTTDAIGLVSLQIGTGTVVSGLFSNIDWGNAVHFIKLEADFSGGNIYVTLGTQELMSVPYAMYASKTDTNSLHLTNRFAEKAPVNNPTFTGTVGGISKTMVGLGSVDNTSDANKPVSTATQTALNAKVNISVTSSMLSKYLRKADFPSGSNVGEFMYWNGTNWISLAPATTGQSIIMSSTGTPTWGCIITNTAATASSSPTLLVNTALTPSITIATTGATGIGAATNLPAGVTAAWSANVITISGTPTAAGTFNYTIPLTGGCGTANATGTIITSSACPTTTITYNSYTYNTVGIGTQCWMAENLRTRKYNDGTDIRFDNSGSVFGDESQTWAGTGLNYGAHTIYAHDSATTSPSNLTSYGYLYNWYAAKGIYKTGVIASTDTLNICPSGWHVPTDSDWNKLVKFIDSGADTSSTSPTQSTTAGNKLKSMGTTYWSSESSGTDNSSGFSALPGGYRNINGSFSSIRNNAVFWSATEISSFAWYRTLSSNAGVVNRGYNFFDKSVGASVRCLRD